MTLSGDVSLQSVLKSSLQLLDKNFLRAFLAPSVL